MVDVQGSAEIVFIYFGHQLLEVGWRRQHGILIWNLFKSRLNWSLLSTIVLYLRHVVEIRSRLQELQSREDRTFCTQDLLVYAVHQRSLASLLGWRWQSQRLQCFQLQPGDHLRFRWLQERRQRPWHRSFFVLNERCFIFLKYHLHNLRALLNFISFKFTWHFNFELRKLQEQMDEVMHRHDRHPRSRSSVLFGIQSKIYDSNNCIFLADDFALDQFYDDLWISFFSYILQI